MLRHHRIDTVADVRSQACSHYDLISKNQAFKEWISRLEEGAKLYRIALLCAEKDPLKCHRAVLVSGRLDFKEA